MTDKQQPDNSDEQEQITVMVALPLGLIEFLQVVCEIAQVATVTALGQLIVSEKNASEKVAHMSDFTEKLRLMRRAQKALEGAASAAKQAAEEAKASNDTGIVIANLMRGKRDADA